MRLKLCEKRYNKIGIRYRKLGNRALAFFLNSNKKLSRFLFEFLKLLKITKSRLYLVGGIVRDILEGLAYDNAGLHDVDLMVSGIDFKSLGDIFKVLRKKDLGLKSVISVGKHFPVYKVYMDWQGDPIDVALARKEYSTGLRHDEFDIFTDSVSPFEDSKRRDFTFNAIFYGLYNSKNRLSGHIVDYQNGLQALIDREIIAVGDPFERFYEDPLRMLRAIRQKNQRSGFFIETSTWGAIVKLSPGLLHTISGERIAAELIKSLCANFAGTVEDFIEAGVFHLLIPEIFAVESKTVSQKLIAKFNMLDREYGDISEDLRICILLSELVNVFPDSPRLWANVISRLYLPNQKRLINVLSIVSALSLLNNESYPIAVFEELVAGNPNKEDVLRLFEVQNAMYWHFKYNFREYLTMLEDSPKLVGGNDLKILGINDGPDMKIMLRILREIQLKFKITDREELLKFVRTDGG